MIQKRLLLFFITFLHILYDNWVPIPSCNVIPGPNNHEFDHANVGDDLKVMMVADLLLSAPERGPGYLDLHFKDFYFSRFFRKSFEFLKPDMLIVLGDVSAQGAKLSQSKWFYVLHKFHSLLGPFLEIPYHVVPGDRDIGECRALKEISVNKITRSFPGLDSAGCGAFGIGNVNFVSLNSVALLCGNNDLRFSVEKALEREHIELQTESKQITNEMNESHGVKIPKYDFNWRENTMSTGTGPVLLLHFPLHIPDHNWKNMYEGAESLHTRKLVGAGSYELSQTLPPNATEYIFHTLKPRMVFSAHAQTFDDRVHADGTQEIVVPAMSWDAGTRPAFVAATFRKNGSSVMISHCQLAARSHVLAFYISLFFVSILTVQTIFRS